MQEKAEHHFQVFVTRVFKAAKRCDDRDAVEDWFSDMGIFPLVADMTLEEVQQMDITEDVKGFDSFWKDVSWARLVG